MTGEQIFWKNVNAVRRDLGGDHISLDHAAATEIFRWCLANNAEPNHHRRAWLEKKAPALLAYIEHVADGESAAWRAMAERVRACAAAMKSAGIATQARRPSLEHIWWSLPAFGAIGQLVLDR